ncbi:MAG TPA: PrsW family glutamic-type intramembrane protease [Anaerolineales bacterium]|nr:PrsW family glutamic-type intramembrane protease [Anaerolineales bacterium]
MDTHSPGKFLPILTIFSGFFLILSGVAAGTGYLGLSLTRFFGAEILIGELSVTGAVALGILGGGMAMIHGMNAFRRQRSNPVRLPQIYLFYLAFALVLGVGNILLVGRGAGRFDDSFLQLLFPPVFILGASLPVLAALAFAFRRMGWPVTWRQASLMLVSGGTLSIIVTFILGSLIPYIIYLLIAPMEFLAEEFLYVLNPDGPGFFERLIFSPLLIFYLLYVAFQAPFPEELAKALGPVWMGRRIRSERMAFALGLASGAGFAIVENMRYQGLFAQFYGWSWGGITALRGIGAVDHALWTAIISLALYREQAREPGWLGRLARAYFFSVGLHTIWNGGYLALLYLIGLDHFAGAGPSFSIYGEYIEISLIVILLAMTLLNWWILIRYLNGLQTDAPIEVTPQRVSPRALAGWAFATVMVIVPIGAALGQAWEHIRAVMF